ncbi:MAG: hypothetical protein Q8K60_07460 [Parachlamydiaceae bacterium]|nr:hypothetical protein [Parachlamydiaceae bacterium]
MSDVNSFIIDDTATRARPPKPHTTAMPEEPTVANRAILLIFVNGIPRTLVYPNSGRASLAANHIEVAIGAPTFAANEPAIIPSPPQTIPQLASLFIKSILFLLL